MVSQGLTPKSDTHFESIWILAFLSDKCDSWSNYQLNYLPQRGEILTQRSNLTTQRAKNTLISCICYRSRFRHKAGLLRTFPPFFPETRKLESAVYSEQNIFFLAYHFCWTHRENSISMKQDLIDIFPPLLLFESATELSSQTHKSLVFLDSSLERSVSTCIEILMNASTSK